MGRVRIVATDSWEVADLESNLLGMEDKQGWVQRGQGSRGCRGGKGET